MNYIRETQKEMRMVVWPTGQKIALFTCIIVIFTVVTSYLLAAIDHTFLLGLTKLISIVK